jgi:isocitrate dehydrogenase (NAD+)
MAKHQITLIPGDGIGPEITNAVVDIVETAGLDVEWERHLAGAAAAEAHGAVLPRELLDSIARNKVALKGPLTTPVGGGFASVNVGLRKALELFANLRPVWNLPGVRSRYDGVDLVIVRENTEDLYSGLEHEVVPGVIESLKIITLDASTRIAQFAFDYARRHKRTRVTAVHKANIMKMSDGLFLKCVRDVAAAYPEITQDDRIVDAACMHLVMHPEQFDVLLLPNLYGDIVSDLCAGLVGGLGVVPAANLGTDVGVRSRARQRTGHRGAERGEPDRAAALRRAHAAAHRRGADGRSHHARAERRADGTPCEDARPRRHGEHDGVRVGGLQEAGRLTRDRAQVGP